MLDQFGPVMNGFIKGLLLAVGLGSLAGLALYLTPLSEANLPSLDLGIMLFCVFMGGWWAARRSKSRGLLTGLKVSFLFIGLSLLVTVVFMPGNFNWTGVLIKFIPMAISGALGGIFGVGSNS